MTQLPTNDISCIKTTYDELIDNGQELALMIKELRALGHSGLVLHCPVTGERVEILPRVNELLLQLRQEAEQTKDIHYDPSTKTIVGPPKMTVIGQSSWSDTAVWGGSQSREVDHNAPGAAAPYDKNIQTLKNQRTFVVSPVRDYSKSTHLGKQPEDVLSITILTGLSRLSGLKEKLAACLMVNAGIERYISENTAKDDAPKKDASVMQARFNNAMQKIRMAKNGPKTVAQLADPGVRSAVIEDIMKLEGSNIAFVVPFRECMDKSCDVESEGSGMSWKVVTSVNLGGAHLHRPVPEPLKIKELWHKVRSVLFFVPRLSFVFTRCPRRARGTSRHRCTSNTARRSIRIRATCARSIGSLRTGSTMRVHTASYRTTTVR